MKEFSFNLNESSSYLIRQEESLRLNLLISVTFFVLFTLFSNWEYGLIVSLFSFIIQLLKAYNRNTYFIKYLCVYDEEIILKYNKKTNNEYIRADRKYFMFKKKIAFNRTRTPYLAVYYKNDLLIKQFEIGDWNECEFDKIISFLTPTASASILASAK